MIAITRNISVNKVITGVVDTSVFIALESGRPLRQDFSLGDMYATVITLGELDLGIFSASSADVRAIRLHTIQLFSRFQILPVDEAAANEWAHLRYQLGAAKRRININDLWIAAIAKSRGLPVVTQDDDFEVIAEVGGPEVIRV